MSPWLQGKKIFGSIIIFNAVYMMDKIAFWEQLPICFFPDKNMLKDIALFIGAWMVRAQRFNVTSARPVSSAFPIGIVYCLVGTRTTANGNI